MAGWSRLRPWLRRWPALAHLARGVQIRAQRRGGRGGDAVPLRPDLERYAPLFEGSAQRFNDLVHPWLGEFRWPVGRVYNGAFESVDAELYRSVLRSLRPHNVIEVGGGHSTGFARDALAANGFGRLLVIDPFPNARLPRGVSHLASRVEDADPSIFAELGAGDVLFTDSSHTTEEARFHTEELLPRLAPGVLVHHHDILFPFVGHYGDDPDTYGEPEVLLDFYRRNTEDFEVLVGAAWVLYANPKLVVDLIGSYAWRPQRIPGSLWARKRQ